jgi:GNAT superfamily N-acetyltransferase
MQIERASPADIDAVHRLLADQFDEHDIDTSPEALRRAIAAVFEHEHLGFFLVARDGGEIIGLAAISFAWTLEHGGKSAWLDELYVVAGRREEGVGGALLERVIRETRELGCQAIDLEVDAAHRRAERLYKRAGFRRLARARWVKLVNE